MIMREGTAAVYAAITMSWAGSVPAKAAEFPALGRHTRRFAHPGDVVNDPGLLSEQKRAILAAWASDACAVESRPAWRRLPGSDHAVPVDDVLDALRALDDGPSAVERPYRQRPAFGKMERRPMIRPVDPGSAASPGRH
jgi:hypothetical protein